MICCTTEGCICVCTVMNTFICTCIYIINVLGICVRVQICENSQLGLVQGLQAACTALSKGRAVTVVNTGTHPSFLPCPQSFQSFLLFLVWPCHEPCFAKCGNKKKQQKRGFSLVLFSAVAAIHIRHRSQWAGSCVWWLWVAVWLTVPCKATLQDAFIFLVFRRCCTYSRSFWLWRSSAPGCLILPCAGSGSQLMTLTGASTSPHQKEVVFFCGVC